MTPSSERAPDAYAVEDAAAAVGMSESGALQPQDSVVAPAPEPAACERSEVPAAFLSISGINPENSDSSAPTVTGFKDQTEQAAGVLDSAMTLECEIGHSSQETLAPVEGATSAETPVISVSGMRPNPESAAKPPLFPIKHADTQPRNPVSPGNRPRGYSLPSALESPISNAVHTPSSSRPSWSSTNVVNPNPVTIVTPSSDSSPFFPVPRAASTSSWTSPASAIDRSSSSSFRSPLSPTLASPLTATAATKPSRAEVKRRSSLPALFTTRRTSTASSSTEPVPPLPDPVTRAANDIPFKHPKISPTVSKDSPARDVWQAYVAARQQGKGSAAAVGNPLVDAFAVSAQQEKVLAAAMATSKKTDETEKGGLRRLSVTFVESGKDFAAKMKRRLSATRLFTEKGDEPELQEKAEVSNPPLEPKPDSTPSETAPVDTSTSSSSPSNQSPSRLRRRSIRASITTFFNASHGILSSSPAQPPSTITRGPSDVKVDEESGKTSNETSDKLDDLEQGLPNAKGLLMEGASPSQLPVVNVETSVPRSRQVAPPSFNPDADEDFSENAREPINSDIEHPSHSTPGYIEAEEPSQEVERPGAKEVSSGEVVDAEGQESLARMVRPALAADTFEPVHKTATAMVAERLIESKAEMVPHPSPLATRTVTLEDAVKSATLNSPSSDRLSPRWTFSGWSSTSGRLFPAGKKGQREKDVKETEQGKTGAANKRWTSMRRFGRGNRTTAPPSPVEIASGLDQTAITANVSNPPRSSNQRRNRLLRSKSASLADEGTKRHKFSLWRWSIAPRVRGEKRTWRPSLWGIFRRSTQRPKTPENEATSTAGDEVAEAEEQKQTGETVGSTFARSSRGSASRKSTFRSWVRSMSRSRSDTIRSKQSVDTFPYREIRFVAEGEDAAADIDEVVRVAEGGSTSAMKRVASFVAVADHAGDIDAVMAVAEGEDMKETESDGQTESNPASLGRNIHFPLPPSSSPPAHLRAAAAIAPAAEVSDTARTTPTLTATASPVFTPVIISPQLSELAGMKSRRLADSMVVEVGAVVVEDGEGEIPGIEGQRASLTSEPSSGVTSTTPPTLPEKDVNADTISAQAGLARQEGDEEDDSEFRSRRRGVTVFPKAIRESLGSQLAALEGGVELTTEMGDKNGEQSNASVAPAPDAVAVEETCEDKVAVINGETEKERKSRDSKKTASSISAVIDPETVAAMIPKEVAGYILYSHDHPATAASPDRASVQLLPSTPTSTSERELNKHLSKILSYPTSEHSPKRDSSVSSTPSLQLQKLAGLAARAELALAQGFPEEGLERVSLGLVGSVREESGEDREDETVGSAKDVDEADGADSLSTDAQAANEDSQASSDTAAVVVARTASSSPLVTEKTTAPSVSSEVADEPITLADLTPLPTEAPPISSGIATTPPATPEDIPTSPSTLKDVEGTAVTGSREDAKPESPSTPTPVKSTTPSGSPLSSPIMTFGSLGRPVLRSRSWFIKRDERSPSSSWADKVTAAWEEDQARPAAVGVPVVRRRSLGGVEPKANAAPVSPRKKIGNWL
ncbi:hypothetical protein HDU96_007837 [Phlyctochytrium bullatum]|nr:hypothetical protein HDU96_007837 [Phlyctochytrium bullatum]